MNLYVLGMFRATGITSKVYSADVMRSRGSFLLAALEVERKEDHKLLRRQGSDTRAVLQS